ncbi:EmrB/QacA subfamily drug resistance transporter [Paraburkholderia graminis]|uniref:MFS transporter n=1 Tax=Paraburkholderia graminis TaxID=60548 RepID=UPI0028623E8F|nr:MFS transporter [Paraburkholderia graminis]MDR6477408.1 EmrB/QacA subfamily drug resistance transporter [Paraburkholderia graminis]
MDERSPASGDSVKKALLKLKSARYARVRRWFSTRSARVLLCTSGVSFMIMLDSNIVAVSLPTIARDLNASFTDIEWVVSAYVLPFAAFLMPAGALADRFGRRRLLLTGMLLFTFASFVCGLAPNSLILNASRGLQGLGSALQLSAALAVLAHTFRGAERARAFAFWGTLVGVAVAIGPLIGGFITSTVGWRWAFLVNVPVGAGLIAVGFSSVDESNDPHSQKLDLAGITFFGGGLFCLVWGLINANVDGWLSNVTLGKLSVAAALLFCFVIAELVQKRPMVDFSLFRRRTFLGSSIAMLGFASAAQVMMTYLPLYLQNSFGFSPALAGYTMMPFALPLFFLPRVGAILARSMSGRAILTIGLSIVACGNLSTALVVLSGGSLKLLWIGMLITGCGAGLLNGETTKVSMAVIPSERSGMASGIGATLRFVGLVLGITCLGAILTSETRRQFIRAGANEGLPQMDGKTIELVISHIVAGDTGGRTVPAVTDQVIFVARNSFELGFASVLFVAAAVAAVCATLTYLLVDVWETAPQSVSLRGESSTVVD